MQRITLLLGLTFSMLMLAATVTPGRTEVVQNWQAAMNYPARVGAVYWGGTRLDAGNPVRFGAWTVAFNPQIQYVAKWIDVDTVPQLTHEIIIGNELDANKALTCSNAIAGREPCQLNFIFVPSRAPRCEVFKHENSFVIPCPSALDLQR